MRPPTCMGRIRHSAIIVTGSGKGDADFAHAKAAQLGLIVTPVVSGTNNGYASFLICPDGSKEGWDTSIQHDKARASWIDWVESKPNFVGQYGRQGLYLDWAYLDFGGDDDTAVIRDHSDSDEHSQNHSYYR